MVEYLKLWLSKNLVDLGLGLAVAFAVFVIGMGAIGIQYLIAYMRTRRKEKSNDNK